MYVVLARIETAWTGVQDDGDGKGGSTESEVFFGACLVASTSCFISIETTHKNSLLGQHDQTLMCT